LLFFWLLVTEHDSFCVIMAVFSIGVSRIR
jgi:hypothetical protein